MDQATKHSQNIYSFCISYKGIVKKRKIRYRARNFPLVLHRKLVVRTVGPVEFLCPRWIVDLTVDCCVSDREFNVKAKCVINATGPYTDSIRTMGKSEVKNICQPSSGVHVVLPNYYR